jgi:hypothetical protein
MILAPFVTWYLAPAMMSYADVTVAVRLVATVRVSLPPLTVCVRPARNVPVWAPWIVSLFVPVTSIVRFVL